MHHAIHHPAFWRPKRHKILSYFISNDSLRFAHTKPLLTNSLPAQQPASERWLKLFVEPAARIRIRIHGANLRTQQSSHVPGRVCQTASPGSGEKNKENHTGWRLRFTFIICPLTPKYVFFFLCGAGIIRTVASAQNTSKILRNSPLLRPPRPTLWWLYWPWVGFVCYFDTQPRWARRSRSSIFYAVF